MNITLTDGYDVTEYGIDEATFWLAWISAARVAP